MSKELNKKQSKNSKSAKSSPPKNTHCIYCSVALEEGNRSEDHVPPACFFTDNERAKFKPIKVPSCKKCNNGCSRQDENAKHFLNLCVRQMHKDTNEQREHHKKTLKKNARLNKHLLNSKKVLLQDVMTGIYTFERSISIEKKYLDDAKSVILRAARGLYWDHCERIMDSKNYEVRTVAGVDLQRSVNLNIFESYAMVDAVSAMIQACKRIDLMPGVFTYWISEVPDLPSYSFLLYREAVLFYVGIRDE